MRFATLLVVLVFGLFLTSCHTMPPPLARDVPAPANILSLAKKQGLVPIAAYDPTLRVDQRYATSDNVFKRVLYPPGFPALLADPTARKLAMANQLLKRHGLCLLVLDAYRPPEVQWQLYQLYRDDKFVADPRKKWSKHCYGRAVDVTLTALADATHTPLTLPSEFDDFSRKAAATYVGKDPRVRRRLALLQQAMTAAGFSLYADEWWHFNDLSDASALAGRPIFGREIGLRVGG